MKKTIILSLLIVFAQLIWGQKIYSCYQLKDNEVMANRFYFFLLIDNRKSACDFVIDVEKFTLYHKYKKKFLPIKTQSERLYKERRAGILNGFRSSHIVKNGAVYGGIIFCDLPKNIITSEEIQLYYNGREVEDYFFEPLKIQHLSLDLPIIFYDSKPMHPLTQKKIKSTTSRLSLSNKELNLEPLMFYHSNDKKYIYVVISVWGNDKLFARINVLHQKKKLSSNYNFTHDFTKEIKIKIKNNEYFPEQNLPCVSQLKACRDYKDIFLVKFEIEDMAEDLLTMSFFYNNKKYIIINRIKADDESFLLPRALNRVKSFANGAKNLVQ